MRAWRTPYGSCLISLMLLLSGCSNVIAFPVGQDTGADSGGAGDAGSDGASETDAAIADTSRTDAAANGDSTAAGDGSLPHDGSMDDASVCNRGFRMGQNGCVDVDECATDNGGCSANRTCTNLPGSFICSPCAVGYESNGQGGCQDINECNFSQGGCDARTSCTNTPGSFSCSACPTGFTGTGLTGCRAVGPETLLVLAFDEGGCEPNTCVRGLSYRAGGTWSSTVIGSNGYSPAGGGLTAVDGRAWGIYSAHSGGGTLTAEWTQVAGWQTARSLPGTVHRNYISQPIGNGTHAMFAVATPSAPVSYHTLPVGTSTALTSEDTSVGDHNSQPVLTMLGADVLLVVPTWNQPATTFEYTYRVRRNGVWSAATTIGNLTYDGNPPPTPTLVTTQDNNALILLLTGDEREPRLESLVFSSNTWWPQPIVADDLPSYVATDDRSIAMTRIADGRIAAVYRTETGGLKVGYFNNGWSVFSTVPNANVNQGGSISLAPGISGATMELLYVTPQGRLQHMRNSGGNWSAPTNVSEANSFGLMGAVAL